MILKGIFVVHCNILICSTWSISNEIKINGYTKNNYNNDNNDNYIYNDNKIKIQMIYNYD